MPLSRSSSRGSRGAFNGREVLPNAAVAYAVHHHAEETFAALCLEDRPLLPAHNVQPALDSVGVLLGLSSSDISRLLKLQQKEASLTMSGMSLTEFIHAVRSCAVLHGHLALDALPALQVPDLSSALHRTFVRYSQSQSPLQQAASRKCKCRAAMGCEPEPLCFATSFGRLCQDAGLVMPEGPMASITLDKIWTASASRCNVSIPEHMRFSQFLRALAVVAGHLKAEVFVAVAALGLTQELPRLRPVAGGAAAQGGPTTRFARVGGHSPSSWALPSSVLEQLPSAVQEAGQYGEQRIAGEEEPAAPAPQLTQTSAPGAGAGAGSGAGSPFHGPGGVLAPRQRPHSAGLAGLTLLSPTHMIRPRSALGRGALEPSGPSPNPSPKNLLSGGAIVGGWVNGPPQPQAQPQAEQEERASSQPSSVPHTRRGSAAGMVHGGPHHRPSKADADDAGGGGAGSHGGARHAVDSRIGALESQGQAIMLLLSGLQQQVRQLQRPGTFSFPTSVDPAQPSAPDAGGGAQPVGSPVAAAGGSPAPELEAAGHATYAVIARTSDLRGAGTDAHVTIVLEGTKGCTAELPLQPAAGAEAPFQRAQTSTFIVTAPDVGYIERVRLRSSGEGLAAGWHPEVVEVASSASSTLYTFPFGVWLDTKHGLEHAAACASTAPFEGAGIPGWPPHTAAQQHAIDSGAGLDAAAAGASREAGVTITSLVEKQEPAEDGEDPLEDEPDRSHPSGTSLAGDLVLSSHHVPPEGTRAAQRYPAASASANSSLTSEEAAQAVKAGKAAAAAPQPAVPPAMLADLVAQLAALRQRVEVLEAADQRAQQERQQLQQLLGEQQAQHEEQRLLLQAQQEVQRLLLHEQQRQLEELYARQQAAPTAADVLARLPPELVAAVSAPLREPSARAKSSGPSAGAAGGEPLAGATGSEPRASANGGEHVAEANAGEPDVEANGGEPSTGKPLAEASHGKLAAEVNGGEPPAGADGDEHVAEANGGEALPHAEEGGNPPAEAADVGKPSAEPDDGQPPAQADDGGELLAVATGGDELPAAEAAGAVSTRDERPPALLLADLLVHAYLSAQGANAQASAAQETARKQSSRVTQMQFELTATSAVAEEAAAQGARLDDLASQIKDLAAYTRGLGHDSRRKLRTRDSAAGREQAEAHLGADTPTTDTPDTPSIFASAADADAPGDVGAWPQIHEGAPQGARPLAEASDEATRALEQQQAPDAGVAPGASAAGSAAKLADQAQSGEALLRTLAEHKDELAAAVMGTATALAVVRGNEDDSDADGEGSVDGAPDGGPPPSAPSVPAAIAALKQQLVHLAVAVLDVQENAAAWGVGSKDPVLLRSSSRTTLQSVPPPGGISPTGGAPWVSVGSGREVLQGVSEQENLEAAVRGVLHRQGDHDTLLGMQLAAASQAPSCGADDASTKPGASRDDAVERYGALETAIVRIARQVDALQREISRRWEPPTIPQEGALAFGPGHQTD